MRTFVSRTIRGSTFVLISPVFQVFGGQVLFVYKPIHVCRNAFSKVPGQQSLDFQQVTLRHIKRKKLQQFPLQVCEGASFFHHPNPKV